MIPAPRRALAVLAALVVACLGLVAGAPSDAAPARPAAATSGCRAVGGGPTDPGGGPSRATVVVDTGSGPVWSACISFSGSISGIKALELAQGTIGDLNPVYEQYAGEGKAVCKLRGVGSNPPDCLGADIKYWGYFHNGVYARGGAGSTTVRDGDVQGWRYGTGAAPRGATTGTEATSAPPPTTTTRPPTPTTAPPAPTTPSTPGGSGGLSGSGGSTPGATPGGDDSTGTSTTVASGQRDGGGEGAGDASKGDGDGGEGASADGDGEAGDEAASSDADGDGDEAQAAASDGADGDESAAAAAGAGGSASGGSGSSALPSILGFAAVLAAVGGATVLVRRRRAAVTS